MAMRIGADLIDLIHDVLIGVFLQFDEKVDAKEFRDRGLIESAAARPFHEVGGVELIPSITAKAAYLFHALVCNHCFLNGNKRTAVVALDMFLVLNAHMFTMTPQDVYEMAKWTSEANGRGVKLEAVLEDLTKRIEANTISLEEIQSQDLSTRFSMEAQIRVLEHYERSIRFIVALVQNHPSEMQEGREPELMALMALADQVQAGISDIVREWSKPE